MPWCLEEWKCERLREQRRRNEKKAHKVGGKKKRMGKIGLRTPSLYRIEPNKRTDASRHDVPS